MAARVLDVGQCDPDHGAIRRMLERHFAVEVDRVMFVDEAMERLGRQAYDLVLVNRLIFADGSAGSELVRRLKQDPRIRGTPVMLVSNDPQTQEQAVALGAEPGFGKAALDSPATAERLARHLPRREPARAT